MAARIPVVGPRPGAVLVRLSAALAVHSPPVPGYEAVVHRVEGLAVLGQAGPRLVVSRHAAVLHDAAHQRREVRIFARVSPHPAGEAALCVLGTALGQAGQHLGALLVGEALHHLGPAPGHHAQEALTLEAGETGAEYEEAEKTFIHDGLLLNDWLAPVALPFISMGSCQPGKSHC